jgi:hypothetical protein
VSIEEIALELFSDDPRTRAFHRVDVEFTDSTGIRWYREF